MPALFLSSLLLTLCLHLAKLPVLAATEPLSATVSATATVPSTSPTTEDTTAPPSVILVTPHDGAVTNNTLPEFSWRQTFDTNSNFVNYTLYQNGVATYLGISNTGNTRQFNYVSHLGDGHVYLTPTLNLNEGVYDWYIKAVDASNNASYSTTWRLTIDTTPPTLVLANLADLYPYPDIKEGVTFDLLGPQTIRLVYLTEPWATVTLTLTLPSQQLITKSASTESSGIAEFNLTLPVGVTQVISTSFDHAGLTTALPAYNLNLTPRSAITSIPPILQPTSAYLINQLTAIPSLPATISQVKDGNYTSLYYLILLAILIVILLIYLMHSRNNILIFDKRTNQPYRSVIVYHSRPTHAARFHFLTQPLLITNHEPVLYQLRSGKGYIRHLGRYSTLTIRTNDGVTHILSIVSSQKKYAINL